MTLGAIQNKKLLKVFGKFVGFMCRTVGVHINFAPVIDVNTNPNNPVIGVRAFHEGLDFSANVGQPIKATAAGIVISAEVTPEYGNMVRISHGSGLETRYAHASKLLVKEGDRIKKNQVIALVGNTGRSTGPHLHYEIRMNGESLDPRKYLQY